MFWGGRRGIRGLKSTFFLKTRKQTDIVCIAITLSEGGNGGKPSVL